MKILLLLLLWQPCSSSKVSQVHEIEGQPLISNTGNTSSVKPTVHTFLESQALFLDCEDYQKNGFKTDGVYLIYPRGPTCPIPVYCDMSNNGGGWTVFQKRVDGSTDFYQDWQHYRDGFGRADKEYWLGLQNLRWMTMKRRYKLQVDLMTSDNHTMSAEYAAFSVSPCAINEEDDNYILHVSGFQGGDAGDSLSPHNGHPFSTFDRDNEHNIQNCAKYLHGGFWYHSNSCFSANLNGCYGEQQKGCTIVLEKGIYWETWTTSSSITFSQMKIKSTSSSRYEKTRC